MGLFIEKLMSDDESDLSIENVNIDNEVSVPAPVDTNSLDRDWVVSIKQKIDVEPDLIKASSMEASCSIYRVPKSFTSHDQNACQPQVISIGPYHYYRRKDQLQAMEQHKWRYLSSIIGKTSENFLELCLASVKSLEGKARNCYSEEIPLDSNSFVEMLVLDGCFILELFRRALHEKRNDPIFDLKWLRPAITMDLLMLENQIPFFILDHLFNLIRRMASDERYRRTSSLRRRAILFFRYWHFLKTMIPPGSFNSRVEFTHDKQAKHLLHLLHSCCIVHKVEDKPGENGFVKMIHSTSEITAAGVKFKKRDYSCNIFDIKFENGVLEIPYLTVQGMTYTIFLNLIAFEQCYVHCKSYFTGYAYLMDCLINTSNDIEILCENGIIDHWLGSNEDVANLFNKIGRHVALDAQKFYFREVFDEINRYYERRWPRLRATLRSDYFKNPWTIITSVAAIILLLFTLTQTFFTAFPAFAYHP